MIKINNYKSAGKSMFVLLGIVLVFIVADLILFTPTSGLHQVLYLASFVSVIAVIVASVKIKLKIVQSLLPHIAFLLVFSLFALQFITRDVNTSYIVIPGIALLLVWYSLQSTSSKISVSLSVLAIIAVAAIAMVQAVNISSVIAMLMFSALSVVLGIYSVERDRDRSEDTLNFDADIPESENDQQEPDYAMVDVSHGGEPTDWEYILRELHYELKSTHDVDTLAKNMLLFMSGAIDFDAAAMGLIQGQAMNKISVYGSESFTHSNVLNWSGELVNKLSKSRQADVSQQKTRDAEGGEIILHRIDVPVMSSNKLIGVVSIFRQAMGFSEFDIKLASSIVFHSMIALQQARLQEEVKRHSQTSSNKTLYNREQFIEKAQVELDKMNQPRTLSLLLVELDELDNVAESEGMEAATRLYKSVAANILSQLQPADVMGRHGKDGLVVLLHEVDLLEAKERAEAFRENIAKLQCKINDGVVSTTVSIGLSSFSEQGETLEELIKKADMGLFVARESGRNSVKVSL